MVFSSLSFLFCFFPAFLLVYYLTPSRPAGARNAVLLVGSSVFYIIGLDGQWAYFALLAASVLVNYGLGLAITRSILRSHGGDIEGRTGKGCNIFEMWIPTSIVTPRSAD